MKRLDLAELENIIKRISLGTEINEQGLREAIICPIIVEVLGYEPFKNVDYHPVDESGRIPDYYLKDVNGVPYIDVEVKTPENIEAGITQIKGRLRRNRNILIGLITDGCCWNVIIPSEDRENFYEIKFDLSSFKDGEKDEKEAKQFFHFARLRNRAELNEVIVKIVDYFEGRGKAPQTGSKRISNPDFFDRDIAAGSLFWSSKIIPSGPAGRQEYMFGGLLGSIVEVADGEITITEGLSIISSEEFVNERGYYIRLEVNSDGGLVIKDIARKEDAPEVAKEGDVVKSLNEIWVKTGGAAKARNQYKFWLVDGVPMNEILQALKRSRDN